MQIYVCHSLLNTHPGLPEVSSFEHLAQDFGRNHEPAGDVFAMADLFVRDSLRTGPRRLQIMRDSELIANEAAQGEALARHFSHDLHQPARPLDGGSSLC